MIKKRFVRNQGIYQISIASDIGLAGHDMSLFGACPGKSRDGD